MQLLRSRGTANGRACFPERFQKSLELITTAKSKTGEKAISSPIQVHDICATCNNEDMSPLDAIFAS